MNMMIRLLVAAFAVWCLSGCTTVRAYQAETAKWQALADQATAALHAGPVTVVPVVAGVGARYYCDQHTIELGTEQSDAATQRLLAHELGHHVLGHCGEAFQQELEANAVSVSVLQAWGRTESQAAREVARRLWGIARSHTDDGLRGHDACAELADLLRRYPAVTPNTDGTCAAPRAER